jgi:hypothetical protein
VVCAGGLVVTGPPASAATLTDAIWTVSKTTDGATGASYTYTFNAATSASLDSITMTVPTGTAGTPSVGTVSPGSIAGGSVSLTGTTLTYSFTSALIIPNEAVSVQVNGLTNTTTTGSGYTSQVTTDSSSGAVDTGTTGTVTITATALTSPAWSASATMVGATGTSYTYSFSGSLLGAIVTSVTMTVPPGTSGTPTVGTVTPAQLSGGTVTLSGTTLTYSGTFLALLGTAVSIQINGLTNTTMAGVYPSEIVVETAGLTLVSGVTAALTFTGPLTVTAPGSLSWASTLNGVNQSIATRSPATSSSRSATKPSPARAGTSRYPRRPSPTGRTPCRTRAPSWRPAPSPRSPRAPRRVWRAR